MMGKLITGSELVAALRAAGLADDNTRRVVIDIRRDEPPIVYTEKFGDPGPLVDVVMAAGVEIKRAVEVAPLKSPAPFNPEFYCGHMSRPYGDFAYLQCAREPGHDGLHGGYLRAEVLAWGDDGRISSGHLRLDKLDEARHAYLKPQPDAALQARRKKARAQALDMSCVTCGADIGQECKDVAPAMMFRDIGMHYPRRARFDQVMAQADTEDGITGGNEA